MAKNVLSPFSARNRGAHLQVEGDFPETARTGLLHLLNDLLRRYYVNGWIALAQEFERIARVKPGHYDYMDSGSVAKAQQAAETILFELEWDKVFDFCESLYAGLARGYSNVSRSDAQDYISTELSRLLIEENLAYEFRNGLVEHRGRHHTSVQISRAEVVLGDPRLDSARKHFNKALRYFHQVSQPDPENAIKEAVCSVEATAAELFPSAGAKTLGDIVKSITGAEQGQLPKALAQTFHGLYGFRSGGEGVAHGGTSGGAATQDIAEYVLAVAASQIILLVDLANSEADDLPF